MTWNKLIGIFTLQELSVKSNSYFDVTVAACATDFAVVNFIFEYNIKQYPMKAYEKLTRHEGLW